MAVQTVFGGAVVWHSEIDTAASKVLAYRFPGVPNLGDITKIDWDTVEPVDVLCGGWPCQPFSLAGKRKGVNDERALWPHVAGAIRALRPRHVVLENVSAVLTAGEFDRVANDLAAAGYEFSWACVRASDVGAPHRRERLFVHASDSSRYGWHEGRPEPARLERGFDAAVSGHGSVDLLPTPKANDGTGGCHNSPGHQDTLPGTVRLLPTPRSSDCFGAGLHGDGGMDLRTIVTLPTSDSNDNGGPDRDKDDVLAQAVKGASRWGKYEAAIRRWEHLTRPAPQPTEPNRNGNPRLSALFSEWMLGWPAGWVTDPAIGISRNDQLRIVGNGVVPQQCIAALRFLLTEEIKAILAHHEIVWINRISGNRDKAVVEAFRSIVRREDGND